MPTPTFYGVDSYGRALYQCVFTGTGGDVATSESVAGGGSLLRFFPCSFTDDGTSIPTANTAIWAATLAVHMVRTGGGTGIISQTLGGRYTANSYSTPYDSSIGGEGGGWYRLVSATRESGVPGWVTPLDRSAEVFDAGWDWDAYCANPSGSAHVTDVLTVDDVQLRVIFYYTDAPVDTGGDGGGSPPEPEPPPAPPGTVTPGRQIDNSIICCASPTGGGTGPTGDGPPGEPGPVLPPDGTNPDATLWQAECGFGGLAPTAAPVVDSENWSAFGAY